MSLEYPERYKHTSEDMINKQSPIYRTHEAIAQGRKISSLKRTGAAMAKAFVRRLDTKGFNPPATVKRKQGRPRKEVQGEQRARA